MPLPRSDAQRIADYIAKTVPTTVGLKIASRLADMKASFAAVTQDLVGMLLLVQTELATLVLIPRILYGHYYAFAEELWKLQRTTSQPAVNAEAQPIFNKWESRGLLPAALTQIATNVFNITVA